MEEDSGKLYCIEKLDREMRSRYQVIVGCEGDEQNPDTTDRSKRSTGTNYQLNRRGSFHKKRPKF